MNFLRLLFFSALSLLSVSAKAQISDNFSDGNFDQNPTWQGDVVNFIVNPAGELQLNASAAGSSVLAVQGNIPGNASWDLHFRLGFSPSTSNLLRIYLFSDQPTLSASIGYYVEIGESGSADALRFYRQDGVSSTLIATGEAGLVAVNPDIHLFVSRSLTGLWTVEAASGAAALTPQFTVTDATYSSGAGSYFGFQCVYTVSNINKFFFDDITISAGAPDTEPPLLLLAVADDEFNVTAVFNEVLNPVSAGNFSISGGIGQAVSATVQPGGLSVKLSLPTALATGTYTLQSNGVQDITGNTSGSQSVDFQFVKTETALESDILINEIMADPTPLKYLPDAEWLELYNRSAKTLDLGKLRIQDASGAPVNFPTYLLEPGAYVAITATSNAAALQAVTPGAVLGVPIGTTTLNNDGDIITISDAAGNVIDRVAYDVDWHTEILKKDGGWSLERINPGLICLGSENWKSCTDTLRGTPGFANSSLSTAADVLPPHLLQVLIESNTSLLVSFSEGIDKIAAQDAGAYKISPSRTIASAQQISGSLAQVRLTLSDPLQLATVYALTGNAALTDCSGNAVPPTDTVYFGIAETAEQHDVIINEIMAKPSPSVGLPKVEWLELLNRSSKIIDLASLRIQDFSGSPIILPSFLLVPGKYVALTAFANRDTLQKSTTGQVIGAGMSSSLLNDDGDVLTLSNSNGNEIDRVSFDQSWHTEAGKEDGGWSLERINYNLPCLGSENWESCPVLPGGTPGLKNAAFRNSSDDDRPYSLWAYTESDNAVLLTFNEGLDKSSMENIGSYHFSPELDILSAVQQPYNGQVRLTLSEPMVAGVLYYLTVNQTLTDCSGNSASEMDTVIVGAPQRPESQDIIINEVMFNPASGNARYIEFYNRSNKVFDWTKFFIENKSSLFAVAEITQRRLAIPGQYHAFTTDAPNIRDHFNNIIQRNVLENLLPTLNDKSGSIRLYWVENGDTVELDALNYSDDWHNALYSVGDRDGVALERIRIDGPTNDPANWTSASPVKTGAPGTPTLPNSQQLNAANPAENMITLSPARLSPDDDGYEDFLDIHYTLPKEGYAATVGIFDSDGNRIKNLVKLALAGTEGSLRWDGDTDDGAKARPGIHVLFAEIFGPDGDVMQIKRVFVVVAKK